MNTPTYKEQFDKITTAYFKDELEPSKDCACFIGNLLNGSQGWAFVRDFKKKYAIPDLRSGYKNPNKDSYNYGCKVICEQSNGLYTASEIIKLEKNFLTIWVDGGRNEDSLFAAMDSTLDMLRKIHESKGEVIEPISFKKRELQTV